MTSLNSPFFHQIDELFPKLVAFRRHFHRRPELGMQEFETAKEIEAALAEIGINGVKRVANTGVSAVIEGRAGDGKTVLLRADMDALPVIEENDCDYKSQIEGRMHACGHDAHMAILLGAAEILWKNRDKLNGRVKLMFQPAEEGPGGARPMIEEGILDDPKVDYALALHVWNDIPCGKAGFRVGPTFAGADTFEFVVFGKGGHGASPHAAIDSIVVAAHVIAALQTVVARRMNPIYPAVVTVGSIQGGFKSNVIAPSVKCAGTYRTFDLNAREKIAGFIEETIKGVCEAFGAKYEFKVKPDYPPTVNDEFVAKKLWDAAASVLGAENAIESEPTMGAEDFSLVLQKVPGCYFLVGSADPTREVFPHHHPRFDIDERCIGYGVALMLEGAFALTKPDGRP